MAKQGHEGGRRGRSALAKCREAKARFREELLSHPDVHGIGIGYRRRGGKKTRALCVVVHVHKKLPKDEVEPGRLLPTRLSFFSEEEQGDVRVPLDVREAAPPELEVACGTCTVDFEDRARPISGGYSIGLVGVAGGTLGGWVWDRVTDQVVLLSNEHVIGGTAGDDLLQPSDFDGGSFPADHFADVIRAGTLDAAIADAIDGDDIELAIECSTPAVYEITDATLEMVVEKVGQTTGLTCGIVELIDYDSGHYGSSNDLWIDGDGNDFSMGGDSGSLYVEQTNPDGNSWKRVVGIHWGGSGNDGVGHPIRAVFQDLNLTTVCGGVIEALIEALAEAEPEEEAERPSSPSLPAPFYRRRRGARFHVGIARDFERRIRDTRTGSRFLKLLRAHREQVIEVLMDGDGWRAAVAALRPMLVGAVTTDDLLEHRVTSKDCANLARLLDVAERIRPEGKPFLGFARGLLKRAEDRELGTVVFGRGDGWRAHRPAKAEKA